LIADHVLVPTSHFVAVIAIIMQASSLSSPLCPHNPNASTCRKSDVHQFWHFFVSRFSRLCYLANMDYEGQRLSELLFYWIILSFGGVGWIFGYIHQDFTLVFWAWLVGVSLSVMVR
jgi:hypothetical protein